VSPPDDRSGFAACRSNAQAAFFILRCAMSVESEVVWLRFMAQVLREQAAIDCARIA
jgi:hypothetical protein